MTLLRAATEKLELPHRLGDCVTFDVKVVLVIRLQAIK